ncbi:interferon alpha-inducible protein 27-like protein 2 [Oryx dammah]|uniref:interferon alpha-inducible protein 27-like protein 2 n=1 Tax=Oryx dammah TaxID=59534 RepID=UPI001A9A96E6|nr:interferon alpha-inducible protein 27-like protein 2 [Oryx dammah]XP_040112518.1 interferon alpha-inducible protein 27-like protein 2 [Oryx dammah]
MSARAIESGEGDALGPLLPELLPEEEEEPSQSSNQASDVSSPGKPPNGPRKGSDDSGSDPRDPPKSKGRNFYHYAGKTAAAVIGGALAVAAVPVVLGAMGFTGAGIAASSIAAKMMSAAAVANGGGVAAGSLVATLQSVGAAGLSTSSNILLGSAGSAIGAWLWGSKKKAPSPPGSSTEQESGSHAGDDPAGSQDVSPPNDKPSASQNSSKNHKK